jgi:hypothetical protein
MHKGGDDDDDDDDNNNISINIFQFTFRFLSEPVQMASLFRRLESVFPLPCSRWLGQVSSSETGKYKL